MDIYVHDSNPADDKTRHCRGEATPMDLLTGSVSRISIVKYLYPNMALNLQLQACFFYNGTEDASFAWALEDYNSLSDFTLQFNHNYKDKS